MSSVLRGTVIGSLLLGAAAVAAAGALGHLSLGVALAVGLLIGASNGYLLVATIQQRAPFVPASIFRLALLTSTGLFAAILLHADAWAVLLGVGLAQVVFVAEGVREGLRS